MAIVIELSKHYLKSGESLIMTGTGFTPNRSGISHLLRPDGIEYNPLRLRISRTGEISHRIDSTLLDSGTFEVWVEDEPTHSVSNHVRFTVE